MKCNTPKCTNQVIDFTDNPYKLCGKHRLMDVLRQFPKVDMRGKMQDMVDLDKQRLIERSNYDR